MNKLILCLLIFIPTLCFSQKLKDVTIDMLQAEQHADSSAHAAYLNKNCEVEFLFTSDNIYLIYKIVQRIKIYDERGLDYADFSIPLYEQGGKRELANKITGKTYNLVNGKIEKTELNKKKDVYSEKTSDHWKNMKFAMPNVKPGSIIDVEYRIRSPYIYQLDRWNFQESIPVDLSSYKIRTPEYFTYTPVPKGWVKLEITKKNVSGTKHGELEYQYLAKDVPALRDDDFVLNKNDYRSSIKFELYATEFPTEAVKYYSKDWNKIGEQLLKGDGFGKEINRKLKEIDFDFAKANSLEGIGRTKYIYDYIRTNYSWNNNYGVTSRDGLKKLVQSKSGSVADINLLLLNLLKKCEVQAYPFVSKSRSSGLLNEHFPTITDLNYVMAYVPTEEDQYILLDATSSFSPMGQIPKRAINTTGIILYDNLAQVIYPQTTNKYSTSTMAEYSINLDNVELVGSAKRIRDGYSALNYRIGIHETDESVSTETDADNDDVDVDVDVDQAADEAEKNASENTDVKNEYEITDAQNVNNIYEKVRQSYTETIREEIDQIGNNIFIGAALDFGIKENPFKEDSREYPVFYTYPMDIKNVVTINIPEGYELESKPDELTIALPDKKATFRYSINVKENQFVIYHIFSIKNSLFLPEEYHNLKEFYDRLIKKGTEKLVLAKKT